MIDDPFSFPAWLKYCETRQLYFGRDGKPISRMQWIEHLSDPAYQVVRQTRIYGGVVSTVWLGLNHRVLPGPPLIFETIVFWPGEGGEREMRRYETLAQARAGHARFVNDMRRRSKELQATLRRSGLPVDLWKNVEER